MSSIDELKGRLVSHGNIARGNRFMLTITQQNLVSQFPLNDLYFFCESVNLPGRTIATLDYQNEKQMLKTPYTFIDDDVQLTFNLTNDYFVRRFFDSWQSQMFDHVNYKPKYKTEYQGTVTISQLDAKDNVVYSTTLINAYPTNVSSIALSNASENSISQLTVTLGYDKYEVEGEYRTDASGTITFAQSAISRSLPNITFPAGLTSGAAINTVNFANFGVSELTNAISQVTGFDVNSLISDVGAIQGAMNTLANTNPIASIDNLQRSLSSVQTIQNRISSPSGVINKMRSLF